MADILQNNEIESTKANATPSFYESFTDSLVKTKIQGGRNVYGGLFRLKNKIVVPVSIAAGTVDMMAPSGVSPTYLTLTVPHGVSSTIPFIFSYRGIFRESLIIPEPLTNRSEFTLQIKNYNTSSGFDFDLTFYVFELLVKGN